MHVHFEQLACRSRTCGFLASISHFQVSCDNPCHHMVILALDAIGKCLGWVLFLAALQKRGMSDIIGEECVTSILVSKDCESFLCCLG